MADIVGIGADRRDLAGVAVALGLGRLPALIGAYDFAHLAGQPGEGVEQVAVAARIDQSPVVMLAVNLDQHPSRLAQQLHTDGDVIDEGAGAAVSRLNASEDDGAFSLEAVLGQKLHDRMVWGRLEACGDLALRGAAPDERGVAAGAESERKGIEQDRLAGAGLASEYAQSLPEFEIEPVDQNDVADRQGG